MPLLEERRAYAKSSRFPGDGKPIYSAYETIAVTLNNQFSAQKGSIKITANAADFKACDHVIIDFVIRDKKTPSNMTKCPCDFSGTMDIHIPSPAPANISEYVAECFRKHSMIVGNMLTGVAGDTFNFTMLQSGYEFIVTTRPNENGKSVTVATTITVPSSTGSIPSIGPGAAAWMHQSVQPKSPLRSRVASSGWATAPTAPAPRFLGVIRHEDVLYNNECDCFFIKTNCDTVFVDGFVQIPLEVAFVTMPDEPVVYARHTADPTVLNGRVGGYRILGASDPAPAGMSKLPDCVMVIDALGMSAIVNL
jgi:hypothetical protein